MSDFQVGEFIWQDLTVDDAEGLRDFYTRVVGWRSEEVPMGGGTHVDFNMCPPSAAAGEGVAGVCHARGENAGLPAQWLLYVVVEDLDVSLAACVENGGEVLRGEWPLGGSRAAVIRDPAGAVLALWEQPGT